MRVGETWSDSQAIAMPSGPMQLNGWVRLTYRLERLERRAGARVAVISTNGSLANSVDPAGAGPISMTGTMIGETAFDLDAGRLVRVSVTMNARMDSPQLGASVPMRMVMTMALVP